MYSYSSKYKDFIKLKLVEKKTTRNKQKIIFKAKSNLVVKFDNLKEEIVFNLIKNLKKKVF